LTQTCVTAHSEAGGIAARLKVTCLVSVVTVHLSKSQNSAKMFKCFHLSIFYVDVIPAYFFNCSPQEHVHAAKFMSFFFLRGAKFMSITVRIDL
jgi:hypothetical protein